MQTYPKKNNWQNPWYLALWWGSFFIVAFGQPAYSSFFSVLASFLGYALFWQALYFFRVENLFKESFFWFFFAQLVGLSWFFSLKYQGPFIVVVYFLLSAGIALQFAFFTRFIFRYKKKGGGKPFFWVFMAATSWALGEWLRLWVLCGFSFNPVGLCLSSNSYTLQMASLGGIYGLSFWVILTNLMGFFSWVQRSKKMFYGWLFCAVFPFVFGFFHILYWEQKAPFEKPYQALLVQTALTPEQKEAHFKSSAYITPYEQWERIFFEIAKEKRPFQLLIFPEVAFPLKSFVRGYSLTEIQRLWKKAFPSTKNPFLERRNFPFAVWQEGEWWVSNAFVLQNLAKIFNAEVIAGLEDFDADLQMPVNAAFHFFPEDLPSRYEKRILVPLGEYIPFSWCKKIAEKYGIFGSFAFGKKAKVTSAINKISISICYEETYPYLIREGKNLGAELLVNLSNDGWFPGTLLPLQHYLHGKIRTVENGVPAVRATNTGITAGLDAFGREIRAFYKNHPQREKIFGTLWLEIPRISYPTLYAFWGDFPLLFFGFLFFLNFCRKAFITREIGLAQKRLS